ncbi:MAG TPA: isocitrate lyase/phosphoenolpyruvate mutase family protein [Pyrinomonadaceae bacterium]|nr:isocitrate lyase/phosphoenolpyruvate mutase family protein [Pyrinomonadaceae bacterium]
MNASQKQSSAIAKYTAMHESGCFVLPNPWDAGTAVYLERLGFEAVATTSAGFAFSRALPDSVTAVSRGMMLQHIGEVAEATTLPVNADFQNGYADEPEGVATSVALCIVTGVAGLSIEDSTGDDAKPLYDFSLAVERIKAARAAVDNSKVPVVLTGRCEAWLVGHADPARVAIERLVAYAEAGADCLYAPGASEPKDIEAIVKAVSPKPVNVLVSSSNADLSVSRLADLGVRRISVGGALARVAWGAFMRAAKSIKETGTFETFDDAAPFNEIQDLFLKRQ